MGRLKGLLSYRRVQGGLTTRQIARKLNRSVTCIYNVKHGFGIPVPKKGGRGKARLHKGQMLG